MNAWANSFRASTLVALPASNARGIVVAVVTSTAAGDRNASLEGVLMAQGQQRITIARGAAALGFLCGVIAVLAGLTHHTWKLGSGGWLLGGSLLALLAVFVLIDGAIAVQTQ